LPNIDTAYSFLSSSIIGSRLRCIGHRLMLVDILSIAIVELLADLLGEGQVNVLAGGCSQLCDTLLLSIFALLNLRDCYALLGGKVLTADSDQVNGLVNTGLDGFRESNLYWRFNRGNNGDIVASLLGNLLAIVVAIAVVSISWGGLADSHHLGVTFLLKGHFHSLGSGVDNLLLVYVNTDLIGNNFYRFTADSPGDWVALFPVNYLYNWN